MMRSIRWLGPVVVGLLIAGAYVRSGRSAEGDAAAPKSEAVAKTDVIVLPTAERFDAAPLPIGKTIGVPPADAHVLEALSKPAEFDLKSVALPDLANQLAEMYKVSIKLDLAALTADGKGSDTILSGKTRNTTLRSALHLYLDEQGLAFTVRHETLLITTKTAAETYTTTRIYQVHDLALPPNDPSARPDFERLLELISSTVQPESWREAGGTQGEYRGFEGPGIAVLVIHQTEDVHEQIETLLADLRAAKIPALLELQKKRERTPLPRPAPTATRPVFSGGSFF